MKFGGTSVRDQATKYQAFKHIRREVDANYKVLVVVSAMGKRRRTLCNRYTKRVLTYHVSKQEHDRLLACGEIISSIVMSDFYNNKD